MQIGRVHLQERQVHPEALGVRPGQRLRRQLGREGLSAGHVHRERVPVHGEGVHLEQVAVRRGVRLHRRPRRAGRQPDYAEVRCCGTTTCTACFRDAKA